MSNFRDDLIKLAHDHPGEIQDALLPVLEKNAGRGIGDEVAKLFPRNSYLYRYFSEADVPYKTFTVRDSQGLTHTIPNQVVIEHIAQTGPGERRQIEDVIRKIDFRAGDVNHFFEHLAGAIADQYAGALRVAKAFKQKLAASNDPHVQARTLAEDQSGFFREMDKITKELKRGFDDAEKQIKGLDRLGSGTIEAPAVLRANVWPHIDTLADWANNVRDYTKGILNQTNQRVARSGPGVLVKEETEWGTATKWRGDAWKPMGGIAGMSDYHWADNRNQIAFEIDASGGLSMVYQGHHWAYKGKLKKEKGITNTHLIEGTPIANATWKGLIGGNESVLSQWKKGKEVNDWYLQSIMRLH